MARFVLHGLAMLYGSVDLGQHARRMASNAVW